MKFSLLSVLAVVGFMGAADAANSRSSMYSSIDMRNSDGDTINIKRSYSNGYEKRTTTRRVEKYSTDDGEYGADGAVYGDDARDGNNRRYARDYKRGSDRMSDSDRDAGSRRGYTRTETTKSSVKRKYFIANPFYQPLQGQFGSVTTGEYLEGTYTFGENVDRKLGEWSIKEDLSFGITDRLAIQGMAKYNWDKSTWKDTVTGDKITYKANDLNVYGLGLQGRIIDTNEWISTLSGYYEHQKHGVDYYIADFKLGYKVARNTIYGLLRGWAVNMDGDVYGDYMDNSAEWAMLVYGDSDDTLYMGELGLGVWSVLAEDWTLNVEGLFGAYDWHNQLSIKGALGWQPNDWFALNLYVKTSLYDTANDKHLDLVAGNKPVTYDEWNNAWATEWSARKGHGIVDMEDFREWSVGLQVMFQF